MSTVAQLIKTHVNEELAKVLFGLEPFANILTIGIIAGGNLLIRGAPGSGKTMLSKALLRLTGAETARIDCGNDIEFTNITHSLSATGKSQAHSSAKTILYLVGLNRLTPNTQAILLPVMEEHQLVNNGQIMTLDENFRSIATYDPQCYDDTYPLLSALLDRFYLALSLGALPADQQVALLKMYDYPSAGNSNTAIQAINPISMDMIRQARTESKSILVKDTIYKYVVDIIDNLRHHDDLVHHSSQRGALAIINAAKIHARLNDRDYVNPDDIQAVTPYCLQHRLQLTSAALIKGMHVTAIIDHVMATTGLPDNAILQN